MGDLSQQSLLYSQVIKIEFRTSYLKDSNPLPLRPTHVGIHSSNICKSKHFAVFTLDAILLEAIGLPWATVRVQIY